jgi:hypothetical protein
MMETPTQIDRRHLFSLALGAAALSVLPSPAAPVARRYGVYQVTGTMTAIKGPIHILFAED